MSVLHNNNRTRDRPSCVYRIMCVCVRSGTLRKRRARRLPQWCGSAQVSIFKVRLFCVFYRPSVCLSVRHTGGSVKNGWS